CCSRRRKLIVKLERRPTSAASRVVLPGQNSTSIGSSDTADTAFTVMACTSSPARATATATPVANRPSVSRYRRASSGGEDLLTAWMPRRTPRLGQPSRMHAPSRHTAESGNYGRRRARRHADRVAEEEALVKHLAPGKGGD